MPEDLIIAYASELITLKGPRRSRTKKEMAELSIIKDGAVVISEGAIEDVGKSDAIVRRYAAKGVEVVDASGKVVMPGLVDPHTHLVFAGSREFELELKVKGKSYMDILAAGGGILRTVHDTRDAGPEELYWQSAKRLESMIAHGTTTLEAKSGYGLDTANEIKMLEVIQRLAEDYPLDIVPTFMGAHAVPPEFTGRPDDYIDLVVREMLPAVAERRLAEFCDVFCEKGVFDVDQSRRILAAAKEHGLKLKVHADEFSQMGGAELAAEMGAQSADHLGKTSDDGIVALARKDVVGVLLPATPYCSMMKDYADGRRLIDLGVPVALATDLNPNCWTESMQFVISLACYKMKMSPAEAITAATMNAAAAIGMEKWIGSLERGKRADLVVMDVPNHAHIPYIVGTNLCRMVIKDGRKIWERSPFQKL